MSKKAKRSKPEETEPSFTRGDVAKILNISPLTVANREKSQNGHPPKYPEPKRDLNNYRVYTLSDVLNLQIISYGLIDTRPIISILYDKGWRDTKALGKLMERALNQKRGFS